MQYSLLQKCFQADYVYQTDHNVGNKTLKKALRNYYVNNFM